MPGGGSARGQWHLPHSVVHWEDICSNAFAKTWKEEDADCKPDPLLPCLGHTSHVDRQSPNSLLAQERVREERADVLKVYRPLISSTDQAATASCTEQLYKYGSPETTSATATPKGVGCGSMQCRSKPQRDAMNTALQGRNLGAPSVISR